MAKAVKKVVKEIKSLKTVKDFLPKIDNKLSNDQIKERISMLKLGMSQSISLSTSTSILALLLFIGAPFSSKLGTTGGAIAATRVGKLNLYPA